MGECSESKVTPLMGLLLRKYHLWRCWCWLSPLNWIGAVILSLLLKLEPWKIEALIHSMKFLSPEVVLYLYKFTIWPSMKYCCHIWARAPSWYFEMLDKLQKWIWRMICPSLAACLEPLWHRRNVASLSLFSKYYFGRCSSELAHHFLILEVGLIVILIDCMIFLSPLLDVIRMSMSTVSFLAQLDSGIFCL